MNISFYLIPKSEVTYIHQEDTVAQALRVIHKHGYQAVPVIDKEGALCWNDFGRRFSLESDRRVSHGYGSDEKVSCGVYASSLGL